MSQNSPQVDGAERFLARSPPLRQGCAGRVVAARRLLGLTTMGQPGCHRPGHPEGARAFGPRRVRSANTAFGSSGWRISLREVEKTSALFLAGFSSLKAVWERTGKQRKINDFRGAGGRAERWSRERAGGALLTRGSADRELDSHSLA